MNQPRILVGCPTSDHKAYCLNEYIQGLKRLTYQHKEFLIVDNSATEDYSKQIRATGIPCIHIPWHPSARERIISSRNILRTKALAEGYDYFFSLEQDVVPPADIIERFLAHKKPIVAGIYYNKYPTPDGQRIDLLPVAFKQTGSNTLQPFTPEELTTKHLLTAGAIGLGCVLIHRDALQAITFRYDPTIPAFDDMHFSKDALQKGYQLFVDPALKCMHHVKNWDWNGIER